jgi:hypothetical protein
VSPPTLGRTDQGDDTGWLTRPRWTFARHAGLGEIVASVAVSGVV